MIRWGIAGAGNIAAKFAGAVVGMNDKNIVMQGIASRNYGKAYKFAKANKVNKAYESYEAMLNSPEIDAVYIATPHPMHCEMAAKALQAKKHVLCEKPMAMNSRQVQYLIDLAYDNNVFLMENMWTRFLPITEQVRTWIEDGRVGEIRAILANFGFVAEGYPKTRWFHRDLGGGALLDVGIYPVSYTTMLMGFDIDEIKTCAYIGETQIDEQDNILLCYRGGRCVSNITCSVVNELGSDMIISGEYGRIEIDKFQRSERAVLYPNHEKPVEVKIPHEINGFEYSIRDACHCIEKKEIEDPRLPWVVTLENIRLMDKIREIWGLHYPCE